MPQFPHLIRARVCLIISIILWSSAFVGIRYAAQEFSPGGLALLRYAIASLCMALLYYFVLKKPIKRRWQEIMPTVLVGIIGFTLYNVFLNRGEQEVSAGVASFISSLGNVMVALLGIWVYHEKLSKKVQWGFFISFLGVCLMLIDDLNAPSKLIGILFTLSAIFCGSIYSVLQKKLVAKMSPVEFTSYAIWGGTCAMLIFTPALYHDLHTASLSSILLVIYMGIFPGAVAYLFSSYSYSHMPVAEASSFSYLIPLFSSLFALIFLHEIPSSISLTGGVIALLGAILTNKGYKRLKPNVHE